MGRSGNQVESHSDGTIDVFRWWLDLSQDNEVAGANRKPIVANPH